MLKSHRVHAEQIEIVAKSMKDLYYTRRAESSAPAGKNRNMARMNRSSATPDRLNLAPRWSLNGTRGTRSSGEVEPAMRSPVGDGYSVASMTCTRCGDVFPVTDYYYTKKSGLCIPCWEAKVV